MKKSFRKIIAVAAAATIAAVLLAACGGGSSAASSSAAETASSSEIAASSSGITTGSSEIATSSSEITTSSSDAAGMVDSEVAGTYIGTIGYSDKFTQEQLAALGVTPEAKGGFALDLVMVLNDDGTFTLETEKESMRNMYIELYYTYGEDIVKYAMREQGYTDESQYDSIVKNAGYTDWNAFVDELIGQMVAAVDGEEGDALVEEGMTRMDGTYEVSGNTIRMNMSDGEDMFADNATIEDDGSISIDLRDTEGLFESNFVIFVKQ